MDGFNKMATKLSAYPPDSPQQQPVYAEWATTYDKVQYK